MKYLLENQETERLIFRPVTMEDYPYWLVFHQDPNSTIHWVAEKISAKQACTQWYEKQFYRYQNDLGGMNALIDKQSGKLVGHCGLLVQEVDGEKALEIGYSLLPAFWHKGYATEAAQKCRDYAFINNFAESLISIISITNTPSERVARNNGMQLLKQTMYHENKVNIFGIDRSQWLKLPNGLI